MQLSIDRTRPQKLYYQLLEILKEHIQKGEWKVGTKIPTEEQLCGQYNVSKATVRLAIEELVSLGYLKKIQGKGTFVRRSKPDDSISMLINFGESDVCEYSACVSRVIENKTLQPDRCVINYLNLSDEDHCFFLLRLIIVDGTPLTLQKLFISYNLMSGFINDKYPADTSPYAFIERRCGTKIQRIKEIVDVSLVSEKDEAHLELASNLPVLRTRHIYYGHGDTPLSFSESLYRTDKYPRTSEFERLKI
ncbi:MAG: GntR family transcriptional regulator [Nitrospirae bacterium]|nr:GntR family transcriptional regulator [Nitrospirota bacterium]